MEHRLLLGGDWVDTGTWDDVLSPYDESVVARVAQGDEETVDRAVRVAHQVFSEGGLPIGASLEDLGKGLRSQIGTMFGTKAKGVRYLEMAEGYILDLAIDEGDEVIGYKFVHLGKMMEQIRKGVDPKEAFQKNIGTYGRYDEAAKYIDPRKE